MTLVLFFLFFSPYFFQPAQTAYNCTACEKRKCPPMIPPCPGNEAIDPCGCCHHCAKQEGDICGGPDWEIGYCDGNRKCATINGTGLVEIPDFGVCKEMPAYSKRVDYFEDDDENCPEQHGCYKMMGHCDCITKRTCIPDFQMSNYDPLDCEPWRDDPGLYDDDRVVAVAVAVAPPCTHYGCNLVENQCICESSGCDRTFEFTNIRDCYNAIRERLCANVTCPEEKPPKCPRDSLATKPHTPYGQCCPTIPSECTCNFKLCNDKCPKGRRKVMVWKSDGISGRCCDKFLCLLSTEK